MLLITTITSFVLSAFLAFFAFTTESVWAYQVLIVSMVVLNICVWTYAFKARRMYLDAKKATETRRTL
jgi:hypothetical protein